MNKDITPCMEANVRIFHYSHDTYGLGHIRRTLAIAEALAADFPQASQLVVSGTPQPSCFKLPEGLDFIKLPDMDKPSDHTFHAPSLLLSSDALKNLREKMILDAIKHFKPDVVVLDKSPAGVRGEMLPALKYLKAVRPKTKLVLGMSDIEDDAMMAREYARDDTDTPKNGNAASEGSIRGQWRANGIPELIAEDYDLILHYGNREIYDPVSEYRLSRKAEAKMVSCGYIGRTDPAVPKEDIRHALKMKTDKLVLVTAGGGQDGFGMLDFYLKTLSLSADPAKTPFDSVVVPGPLMSTAQRRELQAYQAKGVPFTLLDSTNDLFSYLNAADLVISMGGYNSLCEILSLQKRAVIIPHVKPRVEQLIRAGRFAVRGLVDMIHPQRLNADILWTKIQEGLNGAPGTSPKEAGIDMNGAENASRAIEALLGKPAATVLPLREAPVRVKRRPSLFPNPVRHSALSTFS
ncbi:MAG: glycosyltransferase family protein [Nitrospiria bacterium]